MLVRVVDSQRTNSPVLNGNMKQLPPQDKRKVGEWIDYSGGEQRVVMGSGNKVELRPGFICDDVKVKVKGEQLHEGSSARLFLDNKKVCAEAISDNDIVLYSSFAFWKSPANSKLNVTISLL